MVTFDYIRGNLQLIKPLLRQPAANFHFITMEPKAAYQPVIAIHNS